MTSKNNKSAMTHHHEALSGSLRRKKGKMKKKRVDGVLRLLLGLIRKL